jgi:hypothetical protein
LGDGGRWLAGFVVVERGEAVLVKEGGIASSLTLLAMTGWGARDGRSDVVSP